MRNPGDGTSSGGYWCDADLMGLVVVDMWLFAWTQLEDDSHVPACLELT